MGGEVLGRGVKGALGIVGCGAQARYALDILRLTAPSVEPLPVDPIGRGPRSLGGLPVKRIGDAPGIAAFFRSAGAERFHLCISDTAQRMKLLEELTAGGLGLESLVDPRAAISPTAAVGEGCLVNPLASLGPDARLERACVIHSQVNVDHDCVLGDCVNLAPGVVLAGRVEVGRGGLLFTGAAVAPGVKIGEGAVVGAGACVLEDVAPFTTVAGVPAKVIPSRREGRPGPAPRESA